MRRACGSESVDFLDCARMSAELSNYPAVPLRVVHIISGLDWTDGGPTTALLALATALARLPIEVTVVATPRSSGCMPVVEELRAKGVRVQLIGRRGWRFGGVQKLRDILTQEITRANVVHIHALWEEVQYQAIRIARLYRRSFIVRPCGLLEPWSMSQNRLKKRLYFELRLRGHLNAAAAIHFATPLEKAGARSLRLQAPAVVEANGIDFEEFVELPTPGDFRRRLGVSDETPIALFLGRLHPKKGLELLITAFADVALPNAVLAIVGTGDTSYEQELRRVAAACDLGDRVKFVGFLQGRDRVAAYADATVFVLPSYSENFGNVVIESLAAGTPVIVSDRVNVHPKISSAKVGGVVSPTVKELSAELNIWLSDAAKRELAIANARAFLVPYSVNKIADNWLQRYRELNQDTHGSS